MNEQYLERYEIEARRVKQRDAARAMLAALKAALEDMRRGYPVRAMQAMHAAIDQAEAAGIEVRP